MLCDVMLDHKLPLEEVISNRDEFLLLKDVFGRARMETLEFYEEQCLENNLAVEHSRNISAETLPTFVHWHENALKNRATVCDMIGETAWQQFADSCDVLKHFWQSDILGYGIIAARKPE